MSEKDVILVGNPNTGKSTIFNRLTGLHQHTGNWSGKTVGNAYGTMKYKGKEFNVIDLPGIYSINPTSEDEKNAVRQINVGNSDIIVIVLDATCLERNLILALDITRMCHNVILCVNLLDEAERKGIVVDVEKLGELLNIPVVATRARDGIGIDELKELIYNCKPRKSCEHCSARCPNRIYNQCVLNEYNSVYNRDRKLDKLFTNKITGIPIMLAFLALILWITIFGANYISGFLSTIFNSIEKALLMIIPENFTIVRGLFIDGIYKTLSWVVAVMLPPMAIFFPLFAVLEDFGYLPRLSFNMDSIFKKVGASSKMALSMCMGFGCNAAGVIATRIIENPKERLIAVLTNAFIPCNGRFSGLIALSAVFIVGGMFSSVKIALVVLFAIMISVAVTLLVSFVLSKTILKNDEYSTILELPPFRKPKLRTVIIKSFREKILSVLSRAVVVSIPAGAIIWLFQNIDVNGVSILNHIAEFLEPLANIMGMDGYILSAFILGMPANEIVIPIVLMCYMGNGGLVEFSSLAELGNMLVANGWGIKTAICVMLFSIFHFPCTTTLITIYKEIGSLKWTALAFVLPTLIGSILCIAVNLIL